MTLNGGSIRKLERDSIRDFVKEAAAAGLLSGRVLDFGCGKQPYRDIIESAGGTYYGFDSPRFDGSTVDEPVGDVDDAYWTEWDAILCTQVLQYVEDPRTTLSAFGQMLATDGALVITFATCWPEIEPTDRWRFTREGMSALLRDAGFARAEIHARAVLELDDFHIHLGHGAVAWT